MIKTNLEKLVETAVTGQICHPYVWNYPDLKVAQDGSGYVPVGFSGINYTVKVGDGAFDWAWGDHVEPGVSIQNRDAKANTGLNMFACVGDDAVLLETQLDGKDSKLKGTGGVVTGKHGGAERVLVYFPKKVVDRLCPGDTILVRACGTGLKLLDYPAITIANMSPRLLKALNPSEKNGKVRVPVAKTIEGKLVGAGVGSSNPHTGDFDIQASSPETVKEYNLDALRLGDLVAIFNCDATRGLRWHPKAITIGVVAHGASPRSGHGPGLNVLLSALNEGVEPIITRKANLAELLGLA